MKRCLWLIVIACLVPFFGCAGRTVVAENNGSEFINLHVPEDYSTPREAVAAVGDMQGSKFQIIVKPGFYNGAINVVGLKFKDKHIRIKGVAGHRSLVGNPLACLPVISDSVQEQTIQVNVPGAMNLEIISCVIINAHLLNRDSDPGVLWNNAAIQVAWGASVHLKGNLIISSHGHGVAMSYVDSAHFEDNTIIAPRIGVADFNNNFSKYKRRSVRNKIVGSKIAHFYDNNIEIMPSDNYIGGGEAVVLREKYEEIFDPEIKEEFRKELSRK